MQIKMMRSLGDKNAASHHGPMGKVTSYLIDDVFLIDTANVASTLNLEQQVKVEGIFVSKAHLDNIADIAFLADNCTSIKSGAFQIFAHPIVKENIGEHLLNNKIWPDFTKIPNPDRPTVIINEVTPEQEIDFLGYKLFPIVISHHTGACALILEKNNTSVLFLQDGALSDKVWAYAKQKKNLKAIFLEVCSPQIFVQTFKREYQKMLHGVSIYISMTKEYEHLEIMKASISTMPRVKILDSNHLEIEMP